MSWWLTVARERFWLVPMICAVSAAGLGIGSTAVDAAITDPAAIPFLIGSGVDGARELLGVIAGSMIAFTGLVFSITIVTLQLTSGQFSPRVLRNFLRDLFNQTTLGVFIATFVFALVVLRSVRSGNGDAFVPHLGVGIAFLLVMVSVVVFLFYIHHIAQSIRVAMIIARIGAETRAVIKQRYPRDGHTGDQDMNGTGPSHVVFAARAGVVVHVDVRGLARLAERTGTTVVLLRAVGEFVPAGAALLRVVGAQAPADDELYPRIVLGEERSLDQDVGFGLRELVDIAERALSPAVNDPTTAIQVIDQLHDLLRALAVRPLPPLRGLTEDGKVAVEVPAPNFDNYLEIAVDEIARWGAEAVRVLKRLRGMLRDLHTAARPEHRAAIARQLLRWDETPRATGEPDLTPSDVGLRPSTEWDR